MVLSLWKLSELSSHLTYMYLMKEQTRWDNSVTRDGVGFTTCGHSEVSLFLS
eukprot:m.59043 g.59043  ORF g.59043 m.59043 type:complete len:52 (+) comp34858_c0_seq3:3394-3549(+)